MKNGKKVVVTHLGRVGSTVVTNLLKQHPKIEWLDEFFTLSFQRDPVGYDFTIQEMVSMVDLECTKALNSLGKVFVGHEVKPLNFFRNSSGNIVDYLKALSDDNEYTHLMLRRRNVLKRICSSHKAARLKRWHITKIENRPPDLGFLIDLDNLVDYDTGARAKTFPELIKKSIEFEESLIRSYQIMGIPYLGLFYEDDVEQNPVLAYEKIINYLGIDIAFAEPAFVKTAGDLSKDLINYDDVEKQLRDSEFAWMLS